MKLSAILLACSVSAAETDNSPLAKLNNLRSIGIKLILSDSDHKRMDWKEKWVRKFRFNSNRMAKNFVRCGSTDVEADEQFDVEYNTENHCETINQLTSGFSNWTDRYMSLCSGQRKKAHQKNRMEKWQNMLNKGNGLLLNLLKIHDS